VPRARPLRHRLSIVAAAALAILVLVAAVLAVEVVAAGRGTQLVERDPHTADGHIDGPPGAPAAPLRIVWLGDSLAAGVGSSTPDGSVARQVAHALDRPIDTEVLAVSGARIADVVSNQLPLVHGTPDLVLISAGANDVTHLTSLGSFESSYDDLLSRLPARAAVVVLGVPDMGSATRLAQPLRALAGARGGQVDGVVRDVAARHHAAYVDIAAETGPAFRADPDRYFSADHYHPDDAGYGVWAAAISPVVRWALLPHDHPGAPVPPPPKESS
jgi:lysophospholipase L1-like esterase